MAIMVWPRRFVMGTRIVQAMDAHAGVLIIVPTVLLVLHNELYIVLVRKKWYTQYRARGARSRSVRAVRQRAQCNMYIVRHCV